MSTTRKQAIAAAAAAVGVAGAASAAQLPVRTWYRKLTGACGPAGPAPPRRPGTRVVVEELHSRHVAGPVEYAVGLPPGQAGPAGVVCLPGRGSDARSVMDRLHVVDFVAAAGLRYAVAALDGGESYWHRRVSGEDRIRMLLDEFLPVLERRFGIRPRALLGWSMGGYGALLAAERHPDRFRAVAVSSPALWTSYAEQHAAVPDAFSSAAEYARYDVYAGAGRLARSAVSVSCGTGDPFLAADRAFAARLHRQPAGEFVTGCHDDDFWRRMLPAQVRFVGRSISSSARR